MHGYCVHEALYQDSGGSDRYSQLVRNVIFFRNLGINNPAVILLIFVLDPPLLLINNCNCLKTGLRARGVHTAE